MGGVQLLRGRQSIEHAAVRLARLGNSRARPDRQPIIHTKQQNATVAAVSNVDPIRSACALLLYTEIARTACGRVTNSAG